MRLYVACGMTGSDIGFYSMTDTEPYNPMSSIVEQCRECCAGIGAEYKWCLHVLLEEDEQATFVRLFQKLGADCRLACAWLVGAGFRRAYEDLGLPFIDPLPADNRIPASFRRCMQQRDVQKLGWALYVFGLAVRVRVETS